MTWHQLEAVTVWPMMTTTAPVRPKQPVMYLVIPVYISQKNELNSNYFMNSYQKIIFADGGGSPK